VNHPERVLELVDPAHVATVACSEATSMPDGPDRGIKPHGRG
jgi:hypothetical protein